MQFLSANHFTKIGSRFDELLEKLEEVHMRMDKIEASINGFQPHIESKTIAIENSE